MNPDKNRKRAQDLRWIAFQSILVGIVLVGVGGLFLFMYFNEDASSRSHGYADRKGLLFLLIIGVWGLWMIVRGIIYFIRAFSGNEHYAQGVEDVMDQVASRYEAMGKQKVRNGSMHNVLVLLCWVFLFLALVGATYIGYLYWTRPR